MKRNKIRCNAGNRLESAMRHLKKLRWLLLPVLFFIAVFAYVIIGDEDDEI